MGVLLFIIAQVTTPFFNIIGLIYSLFRFKSWKELNEHYLTVAESKDQHSNVTMKHLFNDVLKKSEGYLFGNQDQTISYVIGKNKELKTLTKFGYFWSRFLNKLDANHVEDAVINEEKL